MTYRRLFVSWTIPSTHGRQVTYLLDLVEELHANGRVGWGLEREVVLRPDGTVRSKAPTPRNRYPSAEMRPNPIEAIESGDMIAISREEFERHWNSVPPTRKLGR
jgi:hypothetical protein